MYRSVSGGAMHRPYNGVWTSNGIQKTCGKIPQVFFLLSQFFQECVPLFDLHLAIEGIDLVRGVCHQFAPLFGGALAGNIADNVGTLFQLAASKVPGERSENSPSS